MFYIVGVMVLAVLTASLWYVMSRQGLLPNLTAVPAETPTYEPEPAFVSGRQRALLGLLEPALEDRYRVFCKIRLADVVRPVYATSLKRPRLPGGRLESECLDFVICEKKGFKILGVVQIDGEDQTDTGRRRSESTVDRVLAAAGIPVVHLAGAEHLDSEEVRIEISRKLFLKWKAPQDVNRPEKAADGIKTDARLRLCPKCGASLLKRRAGKGTYAGRSFLICSNYPRCHHLRLVKSGFSHSKGRAISVAADTEAVRKTTAVAAPRSVQ